MEEARGCNWIIQDVVGRGILWAGSIYTLRCYVAFDEIQRNVVMELFLHSCYG